MTHCNFVCVPGTIPAYCARPEGHIGGHSVQWNDDDERAVQAYQRPTRLVVATPVRAAEMRAASVSLGYAEMLTKLHQLLPFEVLAGSLTFATDIVRARNRIAAKVLREEPEATHVLWLDDDQWVEDVGVVAEMLALNVDVVGLPYTNKARPMRWVHRTLPGQPPPAGHVLEVAALGFGFTLTSTEALRKLSAEARSYTDHPNPHRCADIFGQLFHHPHEEQGIPVAEAEQALLSEDYSFCLRWRRAGGRIHLFTRGDVVHHAGPHAWTSADMLGGR